MHLPASDVTLHFRYAPTEVLLRDGEVIEEMATECRVHPGKCSDRGCQRHDLGAGIALCSYKDMFVKYVGRKIALARAIKDLPRAQRKEIWAAYHRLSPIR